MDRTSAIDALCHVAISLGHFHAKASERSIGFGAGVPEGQEAV
jgi:hypothetical protein